ncbi:hypothetical protein AMTR_s00013p00155440 [Amborella trichopoda]|uniref:Uncharacterized protein n=2 Tax=Amborella trichopoda TaxID=13333 RepID=W1PQA6_AMBTC|nr:hypothetical protein AMTR_s00013p00155440 [Amborella trichopoda]
MGKKSLSEMASHTHSNSTKDLEHKYNSLFKDWSNHQSRHRRHHRCPSSFLLPSSQKHHNNENIDERGTWGKEEERETWRDEENDNDEEDDGEDWEVRENGEEKEEEVWHVRTNDIAVEEIIRERREAVVSGKFKGRRLLHLLDSVAGERDETYGFARKGDENCLVSDLPRKLDQDCILVGKLADIRDETFTIAKEREEIGDFARKMDDLCIVCSSVIHGSEPAMEGNFSIERRKGIKRISFDSGNNRENGGATSIESSGSGKSSGLATKQSCSDHKNGGLIENEIRNSGEMSCASPLERRSGGGIGGAANFSGGVGGAADFGGDGRWLVSMGFLAIVMLVFALCVISFTSFDADGGGQVVLRPT